MSEKEVVQNRPEVEMNEDTFQKIEAEYKALMNSRDEVSQDQLSESIIVESQAGNLRNVDQMANGQKFAL